MDGTTPFRVILHARRKEHADRPFPVFVALPYQGPPACKYDFRLRGFSMDQHAWQASDYGTLKTGRDYCRAVALGILSFDGLAVA